MTIAHVACCIMSHVFEIMMIQRRVMSESSLFFFFHSAHVINIKDIKSVLKTAVQLSDDNTLYDLHFYSDDTHTHTHTRASARAQTAQTKPTTASGAFRAIPQNCPSMVCESLEWEIPMH